MPRLFIALRPPPPVRALLLAATGGVPHARWQDDEQFHLTLRYIGEVPPATGDDLLAALGQVHAPAPVVALAGVGRFELRARTNTLWARVTPHKALQHLHKRIDQACARVGLPPEGRAYLPHVTLARLSRSAGHGPAIDGWLADHATLTTAPFTLEHLILYESHLCRDGAHYEPLMRWPLDVPGAMPS